MLSKEISDSNKITPEEANCERVQNNQTVNAYRKMKQNTANSVCSKKGFQH